MTREDLLYVMTGVSPECAEIEPADEDTQPDGIWESHDHMTPEQAHALAVALIEKLILGEQVKGKVASDTSYSSHRWNHYQYSRAQEALAQVKF